MFSLAYFICLLSHPKELFCIIGKSSACVQHDYEQGLRAARSQSSVIVSVVLGDRVVLAVQCGKRLKHTGHIFDVELATLRTEETTLYTLPVYTARRERGWGQV